MSERIKPQAPRLAAAIANVERARLAAAAGGAPNCVVSDGDLAVLLGALSSARIALEQITCPTCEGINTGNPGQRPRCMDCGGSGRHPLAERALA